MDIPQVPENEFTLPETSKKNIRFIKNEEGKRVAQQLEDSEVEEMKTNKDIGVVIVGHVGHTQTEIIEALNRSDFQGKVVLVVGPESMMLTGCRGPMMKEEHLKELEKTIVITSIREDVAELFMEKREKPYSRFTTNRYILKSQKSKASRKKYTQRKK